MRMGVGRVGMGARRGYNLLVAALVALLVPACGGGGEGEPDYYVSVRQFETGTKKFYIMATPSVQFYAMDRIGDTQQELGDKFVEEMYGKWGMEFRRDEEGRPIDEKGEPMTVKGTIVRGWCDTPGSRTQSDLAYCTQNETMGLLYAGFQTNDGSIPATLSNVMGCIRADQLIQITDDWDIVYNGGKVLGTTSGALLYVRFNFETGFADLGLDFQMYESVGGDELFPVEASRPFIVVNP